MDTLTKTEKRSAESIASEFVNACEWSGFRILSASGCVVTIGRSFAPEDRSAFVDCDMAYGSLLSILPRTTPGSDWGTDGGSVGGYSAIKSGNFRMNRSGVSKRVVSAIAKILARHR